MTYARREEIVVATKVSGKMHDGPGGSGLSRVAIMEQVDASLRRLDTDYIDLYMIHRFDPDTPVEETMKALHDVAPRSFRLPTKETLLGWRDLTRPFDPRATLGDLPRFHDSASIVARLFAEAHTALAVVKARRL